MRTSTYSALFVFLLTFTVANLLQASDKLPYGEIGQAARQYLDTRVSAGEVAKEKKRLFDSVETKMQDGGLTKDEALSQIMLDWAFDNESKIKRKERAAVVRACYYFTVFVDRNIPFPGMIEDRMTQDDARKIIDYLNEEVAKGKK